MGFFKKIFGQITSAQQEDPSTIWIYVQCGRCGEKLKARVNTRSELSPEFGNTDNANSYHCRKVLIGEQRCFQQIEVYLKFNTHYKIVDQQVIGGKFITHAEYEEK